MRILMIFKSDRTKRAAEIKATADRIITAGYGSEFKSLLNEKADSKKAIAILKKNHPKLAI
jgi:hypothetical protein